MRMKVKVKTEIVSYILIGLATLHEGSAITKSVNVNNIIRSASAIALGSNSALGSSQSRSYVISQTHPLYRNLMKPLHFSYALYYNQGATPPRSQIVKRPPDHNSRPSDHNSLKKHNNNSPSNLKYDNPSNLKYDNPSSYKSDNPSNLKYGNPSNIKNSPSPLKPNTMDIDQISLSHVPSHYRKFIADVRDNHAAPNQRLSRAVVDRNSDGDITVALRGSTRWWDFVQDVKMDRVIWNPSNGQEAGKSSVKSSFSTFSLENWLKYLKENGFYSTNPKSGGSIRGREEAIRAHRGFVELHRESYGEIQSAVKDAIHDGHAKSITVTGHSLGGSLAVLTALQLQHDLKLQYPKGSGKYPPIKLITFAQPPVGNVNLANKLESQMSRVGGYLRVNQAGDPVHWLLPGHHAGKQVIIPGKGHSYMDHFKSSHSSADVVGAEKIGEFSATFPVT